MKSSEETVVNVVWQRIKAGLGILFRVLVLVVSLVSASIILLSVTGTAFDWYERLRSSIGSFLPTANELSARGPLGITAETLGMVGHGVLFALPAILVLLLAIRYSEDFVGLLGELYASLKGAAKACLDFVAGAVQWRRVMASLLKPGIYFLLLALVLAFYFAPEERQDAADHAVQYVVSKSDPAWIPVRLHVHFDNAAIDNHHELTDRGITLDDARKNTIRQTLDRLRRCATEKSDVAIRPYGFASDDEFRGLAEISNDLNVEAANRRAKAVHKVLSGVDDVTGLRFEEPKLWSNHADMVEQRRAMIPVPNNRARDAFADRVVVLYLSESGKCTVVQNPPTAGSSD